MQTEVNSTSISVLALIFFSLVLIGRTRNLGGKISHPEVRNTHSQTLTSPDHHE